MRAAQRIQIKGDEIHERKSDGLARQASHAGKLKGFVDGSNLKRKEYSTVLLSKANKNGLKLLNKIS